MHLIIIGHSGFIGSELSKFYKRKKNLKKITLVSSDKVNLTSKKSIKYLQGIYSKNTVVIFCAGIKRQLGDNIDIFNKNLLIITNFAKSLNSNIKKIIFFSSAAVYGEDTYRSLRINENTSVDPTSYYGLSKYNSEIILKKITENLKIKLVCMRPPLVYGFQDKSMGYGPTQFISLSLQNKTIVLWGDGSEKREFLYIKDLIYITSIIQNSNYEGVLNIVSGKSNDFIDIINVLKKNYNPKLRVINKERSKPKVDVKFSNIKLKKLIKGYKFTSLSSGIVNFIEEYEKK